MTSTLGISAQLVSSITNFIAMLLTARAGTTSEFGTVAIAFGVYLIVLAVVRSLVAEPLLIRHQLDVQQSRSAVASWAGLALSVPGSIIIAAVGLLLGSDAALPILVLAATLPFLMWQDEQRFQRLAMRRPELVIVYDGAWLVLFLLGYVVLDAASRGPHFVWSIWCVSGAMVGLALLLRYLVPVRLRAGVRWLKLHRDLSLPLLADSAAAAITSNIAMVLLVTLSGTAAAGTLRATTSLYGVLTVLYLGLYSALIGFAQRSTEARRKVEVWSTLLSEFAAVSVTAVLLIIPDALGRELLGETWGPVRALLPFYGLAAVMSVAATGAQISLRAQQRGSAILRARVITCPFALLLPLVGAALHAAPGFCIGLGLCSALTAALLWRAARDDAT